MSTSQNKAFQAHRIALTCVPGELCPHKDGEGLGVRLETGRLTMPSRGAFQALCVAVSKCIAVYLVIISLHGIKAGVRLSITKSDTSGATKQAKECPNIRKWS